jgi:SAM-dependent methyltransferase
MAASIDQRRRAADLLFAPWALQARVRRNLQRALRPLGPIDDMIGELAHGRSFVDVGAMWAVHGRTAFLAEERGATAVTVVDVSAETDEYRAEHEQRGSKVRFVRGDLHDPATIAEVGTHDVVWCAGVLYHVPNPMFSLECLRQLTNDKLMLISASIPETPGGEHGCVFFPHLSDRARRRYDRMFNATLMPSPAMRVGLTTPFDATRPYDNWWWGLTASAMAAMLTASGFAVLQIKTNGFHTRILAQAV